MTRMPDRFPRPTLHIRGTNDLLQAIPYLLGFRPADSLVLVGLTGGQLVVTARMDLADVAEPAALGHTLAAMHRGGATNVVAVVYDDSAQVDPPPWGGLAGLLADECARVPCILVEVLRVGHGRWWSYLCTEPACCPPDGMPLPDSPSTFVVEATVEGMVALPDRAALAGLLAPLPDAARAALRPLIEQCERDAAAADDDGTGEQFERACKRELFAAARAAGTVLDDAQVARFGIALRRTRVRDALWLAMDAGRIGGAELWRDLGRRLPPPWSAAPLFLYGWACWRAGNGALANIAAERAHSDYPDCTATELLLGALAGGVDPRQVPRLRTRQQRARRRTAGRLPAA